ncbi:pentatricopeptide repeat-containing protein [Tanacetum coccineum]
MERVFIPPMAGLGLGLHGLSMGLGLTSLVFNESCVRDLLSWNSMINGYVKSGKTYEALSFYGKIEEEGVMPDEVTKRNVLVISEIIDL